MGFCVRAHLLSRDSDSLHAVELQEQIMMHSTLQRPHYFTSDSVLKCSYHVPESKQVMVTISLRSNWCQLYTMILLEAIFYGVFGMVSSFFFFFLQIRDCGKRSL